MTAPSGLGIWIAYGPTDRSGRAMVECGASWCAPRAGFNGWNDPGCSVERLETYRRAGLRVFPWIYPTPTGASLVVDGFRRLWRLGICDGLIVDAEAEWCARGAGAIASSLVARLRDACPDAWIAHAPMDYLGNHPLFPWVEFGALDAVLPQVYAFEHDDRGHAHHLEAVERQWSAWEAAHPGAARPRWPVGCSYRPRTRGYDASGKGVPVPHWDGEGARVAADVAAFLDHPLVRAAGAPSLYSLEAAPSEVLEMLRARVASGLAPTDPAPAPQTLRSASDEAMGGATPDAPATSLRAGDGDEDRTPVHRQGGRE